MQQLIYFIQKYRYFLFFLLLSFISLFFTINNTNFHKSKFISSANRITGGLYEKSSQFSEYLHLKKYNEELITENVLLRNKLEQLLASLDSTVNTIIIDSTKFKQKYQYTKAKIVKNEYHKPNNYLLINRGTQQGITTEMAVINSKGIIGIIDQSSTGYARVQSILNTSSRINARIKHNFYFGTLKWNGTDYNTVQLEDIPRQATIKVGDTIVTGGKSTIFPEGILIGTVKKIRNATSFNSIDIQLFNDMSNIGYVYVVKNLEKTEINTLENLVNE